MLKYQLPAQVELIVYCFNMRLSGCSLEKKISLADISHDFNTIFTFDSLLSSQFTTNSNIKNWLSLTHALM